MCDPLDSNPVPCNWSKVETRNAGGCNTCFARPKFVWENRGQTIVRIRLCSECIKSLKRITKGLR